MTPQEKIELNEWLAENIMGWKMENDSIGWCWCEAKDTVVYKYADWHPTHNIAQMLEVLEKFDFWELKKTDENEYSATVCDSNGFPHDSNNEQLITLAGCLAAKKAWEDR